MPVTQSTLVRHAPQYSGFKGMRLTELMQWSRQGVHQSSLVAHQGLGRNEFNGIRLDVCQGTPRPFEGTFSAGD